MENIGFPGVFKSIQCGVLTDLLEKGKRHSESQSWSIVNGHLKREREKLTQVKQGEKVPQPQCHHKEGPA